jgi:hypothetical protein
VTFVLFFTYSSHCCFLFRLQEGSLNEARKRSVYEQTIVGKDAELSALRGDVERLQAKLAEAQRTDAGSDTAMEVVGSESNDKAAIRELKVRFCVLVCSSLAVSSHGYLIFAYLQQKLVAEGVNQLKLASNV